MIFGFPPNAGAAGTAAYLGVFESLHNVLHALKADGYDTEPPASVEALRDAVLGGNAGQLGQPANVAAYVAADAIVRGEPHLREIEAQWGPAPGKHQSDGRGVFVLGRQFGNVFVGLQPAFGYEGDPMRLLFERGFAPTHAFNAFYRWLRTDFRADVLLHFGMHGALEFMPGKQSGMSGACWPDRLIGDVPNVYLYAANNPSEGTLAKRRSGATLVSHLTPPLAKAGLYKGLLELKDSLNRWRASPDDSPDRPDLAKLIRVQAEAVDIPGGTDPDGLWRTLLETENALIPEGLHVVGRPMTPEAIAEHLAVMGLEGEARDEVAALLATDTETPGAPARPRRPVHPAGARRRPDPQPRHPAHGPQHPRLRSLPHAHRLRDAGRRPPDPAAARRPRRACRTRWRWCSGDRTASSPTAARSPRRWR